MDPLSVAASITGILTVAAKITKLVAKFIEKGRDAPASMHSALSELSDLSICVAQLSPFVQGNKHVERSRKDAISVQQIVVLITALVLNISELEKLLNSFGLDRPLSPIARVGWISNEEKIKALLTRVQASKGSLNLILTIFTWWVYDYTLMLFFN